MPEVPVMNFLNLAANLHTEDLMLDATKEQVGTWFYLQCYCHQHMNGGKIIGSKTWPERKWQVLGVDRSVVMSDSPLWHFSGPGGNCLIVQFYNVQREEAHRKMQAAGKFGAQKRWDKRKRKKVIPIDLENGGAIGGANA